MARLQQGYLFDSRYRLLRKLGEGGYSEVWLAEDTQVRMELVLKIFLPSAQLDEASVDLFREEFKLVYNLNHPNLLKYSYFGVCVGYPYLVMPYYHDGSAEDLLGKCSEQLAWRFLHDVSSGLACLHEQRPSIIHQDIKPANVLLDGFHFVITDFGISASMTHMLEMINDTQFVQGTRPYMPPEKFDKPPQLTIENDIWSLGASLYELLTGQFPFGNRGGESQMSGEYLKPLPVGYSREIQTVIHQCLSRNPKYRPTAKELEKISANKLNPTPIYNPVYRPISEQPSRPYTQLVDKPLPQPVPKSEKSLFPWLIAAVSFVGVAVAVFVVWTIFNREPEVDFSQQPQIEQLVQKEDTVSKKIEKKSKIYHTTHLTKTENLESNSDNESEKTWQVNAKQLDNQLTGSQKVEHNY